MTTTVSNQNELSHHGILGQRWGVRRYQNKDGSLTTLGKKRQKSNPYYEKKHEETDEEKKSRIIKSKDPKAMYENRHLFTTQEINDFNNRINAERNLKNLVPKEVSNAKKFVDKYISTGKTVSSFLETSNKMYTEGTKFYKNVQEIKKIMDK